MIDQKIKRYVVVWEAAKEFMEQIKKEHPEIDNDLIKLHLKSEQKFDNLSDANKRLIISLSNRNMMASVINFDKKEEKMKEILLNYNPESIKLQYKHSQELFLIFQNNFSIKNVESKGNLWKKYCEGIISGANFLSSFKDKEDFDRFVKTFSLNKYTKAALPMLLSHEIDGFGFALACDFLKELGYRDYPKPDVHLIKIFFELGLSNSEEPFEVYKDIVEMSEYVKEDAYTVDKIFWLISSGRFYIKNIIIERNRDRFINYTKEKLKNLHNHFN